MARVAAADRWLKDHPDVGLDKALVMTDAGRSAYKRKNKDTYEIGIYILPKKLDEEVARLHLEKIGVKLTTLSKKQADYLSVPVEGPYKAEHYRY